MKCIVMCPETEDCGKERTQIFIHEFKAKYELQQVPQVTLLWHHIGQKSDICIK